MGYDSEQRIWVGPEKKLFYDRNISIGEIIHKALKNYPQNVCQINDVDGRQVTNKEALAWATRIAMFFKELGLTHNDVIGIVAKNSTYVMPLVVACFMNCTPFHAVNPAIDENHSKLLFALTKPKVIFCDGDMYEKLHKACKDFKPLIYTLLDHKEGVPKVEDLLEPRKNEWFYKPESLVLCEDQTMAILCSSGTTGMPKAVCISNHSLVQEYNTTSENVVYSASAMDWFSGVFMLLLSTTMGCTRIITNRPHTAEYFIDLVQKYKITFAMGAPSHITALISCPLATPENLSSLRVMIIGGGSISLPTLKRLKALLPHAFICMGYGFSEAAGIARNFDMKDEVSAGPLTPGNRARIINEESENLGPLEVGEICAHNGHKWNGYYGNERESKTIQDSEGWFHSGDLGYFDEKGYLFVVDRIKDGMKYEGLPYWPGEIENVISQLPEVEDVCVVGIYDERVGDKAAAAVVKKQGSGLTEEEVKKHVAKHLEAYKQLHGGLLFVEKLPQSVNGKTLRREVRKLFEQKL